MQQVTQIIAIRHGETDWNVDGRLQGQQDIALNANGLQQAHLLAAALAGEPMDAIYSSDLSRAYQTAQLLGQAKNLAVQELRGVRERHFGSFQGKTFAQIEQSAPEDAMRWRKRDPDFIPGANVGLASGVEGAGHQGESLASFAARVLNAIDVTAMQHSNQTIVVVTHGGVLDVLYRAAAHLDFQAPRTWNLGNTCVSRLMWSEQGLKLINWASTSHLDATPMTTHGEPADLEPNSKF